jgi:spermidine/putrescine transport system permease protein
MVESSMTEPTSAPRAGPSYAGWIGRIAASGPYSATIGWVANSARARLVLLLAVPLIWIVMLHIGPIYQMGRISFLDDYPPTAAGPVYTFDNYRQFFQEPLYFVPFVRSIIFAAVVTTVTLIVVYPVAYYVAKVVKPRNRTRALLLLLIPFWAGEIIRTFSVIMLLANRGAINVLMREIGLIDRPIPLLYNYFSLSFGVIYLLALYMLLPLYSAIEKIPPQLVDAAADLGAGPLQRFRRVILPLSKDGIVSGCSLVYLTTIGVFAAPLLLGGPNSVIFPEIIASLFHGSSDKWPEGAAFSILMLVVSLSTVGLFMRVAGGRSVRLM